MEEAVKRLFHSFLPSISASSESCSLFSIFLLFHQQKVETAKPFNDLLSNWTPSLGFAFSSFPPSTTSIHSTQCFVRFHFPTTFLDDDDCDTAENEVKSLFFSEERIGVHSLRQPNDGYFFCVFLPKVKRWGTNLFIHQREICLAASSSSHLLRIPFHEVIDLIKICIFLSLKS